MPAAEGARTKARQALEVEIMGSVEHSGSFRIDQPVDRVFPLMSPEGEKLWVPGWDYEDVMGTTDLSEDYVFITSSHDHAAADAIWLVKRFEPETHLVELYKIEPGEKVGFVRVRCRESGGETEVEVSYKYMALSESGRRFVSGFDRVAFEEYIGEWKRLLREYFESMA